MKYEQIDLTFDESVAIITLNNPDKLNPLSQQMFAELADAFRSMRFDDGVGAVVITGSGRAFSAGGDVTQIQSPDLKVDSFLKGRVGSKEFFMSVKTFEKPVISAVNGIVAGGAVGLVLSSDVVFASEKARFSVIFRKIGMVPDCGVLYLLPKLVGPAKAKELAFSGDIIDAQEMYRLGIAQHVVPADELLPAAIGFARDCANGPQMVIGMAKMIIDRCVPMSIEEFFDYESLLLPMIMGSADFDEGVDAFLNKREAKFGKSRL
jgi:2-(1,2-epoxy-1,2-dihydrophenyl)acetyl-CoA isomerase